MAETKSQLVLKLSTDEPIELGNFVGAFTSLANEFERFVEADYSGVSANPQIYVREIRSGCVEADLITGLVAVSASAIAHMDQILVLEDFVRRWGQRISALISNDVPQGELNTTKQLNDFLDATKSIAGDPLASHRLEAALYEDGQRQVRAAFQFSAVEARTAQRNIEDRKRLLQETKTDQRSRVLMIYTRTDVHDARINKKSAERGVIRDISDQDFSIMYGSEKVEQEIRQQVREADENVYKKGFVVDVAVQKSGDKIVAYSVLAFHQIIDLD